MGSYLSKIMYDGHKQTGVVTMTRLEQYYVTQQTVIYHNVSKI